MKRAGIFFIAAITLLTWGVTAGAQDQGFPFTGEVTGTRVNLRLGSDLESPIATTLNKGDRLIVVAERNGWYETLPTDKARVWVHQKLVNVDGSAGTVVTDNATLRTDSRITATIVGTVKKGTNLTVLGTNAEWVKVRAPKEVHCFISSKFVKFVETYDEEALQRKVARAKELELLKSENDNRLAEADRMETIEDSKPELLDRDYSGVITVLDNILENSEDGIFKARVENRRARLAQIQGSITTLVNAQSELDSQKADFDRIRAELAAKQLEEEEQEQWVTTGWLYTVGVFIGRPGTHCLKVGGKIIAFLNVSEDSDLKLDGFYKKRVGVRGFVEKAEGWEPLEVITVTEIEVLD